MRFPVTIPIGPVDVHPHLLFEALAYTVGFQLFLWLRRRRGDPLAEGQRPMLVLAAIAGAVAGSKALAWLEHLDELAAAPSDITVWLRGKTIVGGLLGGWLAVELVKRRMGVTRSTGDLYAIPLAVGIAIGRIGCFLTGLDDRTHGIATSLPWGVDFGDGVLRHPTQLYEIAFLVALTALLWGRLGRLREGDVFKLFMAAYLAWRLAVGFIQPGPAFLGLAAIQWACLGTLVWMSPDIGRLWRSALGQQVHTGPATVVSGSSEAVP